MIGNGLLRLLPDGRGTALHLLPHGGGAQPSSAEAASAGLLDRGIAVLPGEIDHAPDRSERLLGKIPRSETAMRPIQRLRSDAFGLQEEPFLIVGGPCLLTGTLQNAPVERPHVGRIGAIPVDTGLARVHRNALPRV